MNTFREQSKSQIRKSIDLFIVEGRLNLAENKLGEYTHRFNNDLCDNFAISRYNKIREYREKQ